jgi:adenylate cyclase
MASPAQPIERKLAAIFAADVAGYSRLMGEDEVGTMRALADHREVMDRLIGEHRGRIANTAGDSVLAEFPSVVEAVKCAVAVQELLRDENDGAPVERRLLFRIGVHVGDVMLRGADLLGDAINIAARLQSLADPGGVCISGVTHDFVRKTLPLNFDDLALQNVKNIDEPIHAYAVRLEARSATLLANAAGLKPGLAPPDRPSIAVLPFASAAADDEYLGDGIADDVTTALSKMRWLFVIARNSPSRSGGGPWRSARSPSSLALGRPCTPDDVTPVNGFLSSASLERFAHLVDAFRDGLHQLGFREGQNVNIEYRWANRA